MSSNPAYSTSDSSSEGKIRVGVIGVGNWARHGHLRVLDLLPEYEIIALQARRREVAAAAAEQFANARVIDTLEELVKQPDIDLVLVLNTAPQHAETVRTVIAAGKDVYCEWPLTVDSKTAKELHQLAKNAGVRHIVGLQRRLAPHNRYLRDLIRQGFVGKVRSVRMHVSMNYFQALRSQALHWTATPGNFSDVIAIYAGHFLDMLFQGIGKPAEISAFLVNQFPVVTIVGTGEKVPTTVPDQLVLSGKFADGGVLSVHIEGGKRNGSGVQIDITGDQGDIRITNTSAFGDVGDDYVIEGAHGDNLSLAKLQIPAEYGWLPESDLPSAVLELANLYVGYAHDVNDGTNTAPTFKDAEWLHDFFDAMEASSSDGNRRQVA